ncbi:MAG: clostripain-related cysteine peptidase [Actinomycetota bacterium]
MVLRLKASSALAAGTADITVLVYSHGDNDLDGTLVGPGDLNEMVKQADKVNFVVYHDRAVGKEESDRPHLDLPLGYSNGYVFRVGSDGKTKERKDLGEPYTMDPQTLAWFVYYGLTSYPARTTLLVLDDHGGGPNGFFGSPEYDTPTDDPKALAGPVSLSDATASIRAGINAAVKKGWKGGANGKRLDATIFATCVNGNYEVYRELATLSRFVWGSEEVTIGSSTDGALDVNYSASLPPTNSSDFALSYLQSLVADGPALYRESSFNSIASAIFDLDQISTVTSALKQFVEQIKKTDGYRYLAEARAAAIGFGNENGEPEPGLDLYDLGDLIARIPSSAPRDLLTARNALYASIDGARRYLAVDGPYKGARGLSIYFPQRREGVDLAYQNAPDPSGWTRLIRDAKLTGATPVGEVTVSVETTALTWKATARSQGNIPTSATGRFLLGKDAGTAGVQVSSSVTATVGAGGTNQAQAVGTLFEFFLGTSLVTAIFNRDLSTLDYPALLVRANTGKQSEVTVSQLASFKSGKWTFGEPRYLQNVNGALASVTPTASDLIAPRVQYVVVQSSTNVPPFLGDSLIPQRAWPSSASLVAVPVAAGTKLSLIANLWTDNYETEGDLVIEQTTITKS